MDQDIITPEKAAPTGKQGFSPLGCFIAASGATLLCFSLLSAFSVSGIWALTHLFGMSEGLSDIFMLLGLIPPIAASVWIAGRAWYVERRLAQHLDVDTPVFKMLHYFGKQPG